MATLVAAAVEAEATAVWGELTAADAEKETMAALVAAGVEAEQRQTKFQVDRQQLMQRMRQWQHQWLQEWRQRQQ